MTLSSPRIEMVFFLISWTLIKNVFRADKRKIQKPNTQVGIEEKKKKKRRKGGGKKKKGNRKKKEEMSSLGYS